MSEMPEGHSVHRTANVFREKFLDKKLTVISPQGRFASDAKKVSGRKLVQSFAHGKQLFLDFDNDLAIRIHLGIYGKWSFLDVPLSKAPEPVGQVRARFGSSTALADLRGPTVCEVIEQDKVRAVLERLGPDPLSSGTGNEQALRFVERVRSSNAPIGALLMNQQVISGIGNVYRAELLFRAGLNPYLPGKTVPEEILLAIWDDAVKLMRIGVKRGVMLTRDDYLSGRVLAEDRHFVYKREGLSCRVCGKKISLEEMVGRKLYFCPKCQK